MLSSLCCQGHEARGGDAGKYQVRERTVQYIEHFSERNAVNRSGLTRIVAPAPIVTWAISEVFDMAIWFGLHRGLGYPAPVRGLGKGEDEDGRFSSH